MLEDEPINATLESVLIVGQSIELEANKSLSVFLAEAREQVSEQRSPVMRVRLGRQETAWWRQFDEWRVLRKNE